MLTQSDDEKTNAVRGLIREAAEEGTGGTLPFRLPAANDTDVSAADWDGLFQAASRSLARLVVDVAASQNRRGVLECAAALAKLNSGLAQERMRQRREDSDLVHARAALAEAWAELGGIRPADRPSRRDAPHDERAALPNLVRFATWFDQLPVPAELPIQPLAVLHLDLDDFTPITDAHGQAVSDELLHVVASRLTRAVRAEDVVSRLGSEGFACLLADLPGRERLGHLACKLFDAVAAPVRIGSHQLTVSPSIGIAMCPSDGSTAEALLKCADAAMVHAKHERCGYAFFDQTHSRVALSGSDVGQ